MLVEPPAAELLRHGVGRAEVHHIQATGRNHRRHSLPGGGFQACRSCGQDTAYQFIGPFSSRDVQNACNQAGLNQGFHRAATGASKVSYTHLVAWAIVRALEKVPALNQAYSDSGHEASRILRDHVHLGLAVSLEQGLVVPVIRNADEMTLAEISAASKELVEKARAGKLDTSGSTFTISNMGMLNVENFTAIINTGEAAILAVSTTMPQPVVRDGQVVVRQMMKMTLSSDHRIVDGALAAKFINAVKQKLEDLELWRRLSQ